MCTVVAVLNARTCICTCTCTYTCTCTCILCTSIIQVQIVLNDRVDWGTQDSYYCCVHLKFYLQGWTLVASHHAPALTPVHMHVTAYSKR